MNADEGTLTASDGTALYYRCVPVSDARAAVIVVHGIGEHCGRFAALTNALHHAGLTVYGYDQRGHGRSGGARTDVTRFLNYVDDLETVRSFVLSREGAGPLFVYGHSMGSVVAALHALGRPSHWHGVVLASSPLLPVNAPARWLRTFASVLAPLMPRLRMSARIDAADLTHDARIAAAYQADPLVSHSITLRWGTEFLAATKELLREAGRLTMPMLLLHGDADAVADVEGSRLLYEQLGSTDKRLCVYRGLRHELHNEEPAAADRVFSDLTQWLHAHAEALAPPG